MSNDYADLVARLRLKINCEDTLQKWDLVRDDLLKGDMGDGPRMAMESWLDEGDEQRDEAADAIEALAEENRVLRAREATQANRADTAEAEVAKLKEALTVINEAWGKLPNHPDYLTKSRMIQVARRALGEGK